MRKINLLHIIGQLPLGGAENLLLTLARNIDRDKFNLIIVCLNDEGYIAERIKEEGFNVICMGQSRNTHEKLFRLMKLIKFEKIDIVHTHLYQADFWGRLISFFMKVIVCRTEHGNIDSFKNKPFYCRASEYLGINKILDNISHAVIYISEAQKKDFSKIRNTNGRPIVYNAFDERGFFESKNKEYVRAYEGFSPNDILIGAVSRLTVHKGHEFLFRAMKEVTKKQKHICAKLLVIGSGDEEHNLKELAYKLNLEKNILFFGVRKNIPDLMKAMDIFVHPSLFEPFGITIVEAMYSGLPVVATNVGGIPEIVKDGETGLLVSPRDYGALADALLRLIEDPAMARSMGENGRAEALLRFSGRRYAGDLERLYFSLIEGRRSLRSRLAARRRMPQTATSWDERAHKP